MSVESVGTSHLCKCDQPHPVTKLVVLTGGPGAGKTAVLEMAKKQLCEHVAIFPEAASIVFGGGFWRLRSDAAQMASQRAIYDVQKEMETVVVGEKKWGLGLCDRGTLDGLAYWPRSETSFWDSLQTSKEAEFAKYQAVIHLRTPSAELGYNFQNPIRVETAKEAAKIDERIATIWSAHPNYHQIASAVSFLDKVHVALALIMAHVPECCRRFLNNSGTTTLKLPTATQMAMSSQWR
jgi:predicted ATPase